MEENKTRKQIFLEELPHNKNGKAIKWKDCGGYKVHFIYKEIEGDLYIVKTSTVNSRTILTIKYENKIYNINPLGLQRVQLGGLLNKRTGDFKLEIGSKLKNEKRDMTILDKCHKPLKRSNGKEQILKYYKYKCNKCGAENWMEESNLIQKERNCPVCIKSPQKVVKGINDIATTNPEMVEYFINTDDAYKYTKYSNKKVLCKCPNCGYEKEIKLSTLYKYGLGCSQCSDGISYSEKIMSNLLKQPNVNFIKEYSKANTNWCENYRYDFYFKYSNEEYIIETHGIQHYETKNKTWKKVEDIQQNDKNKRDLAIQNGIKPENYIVINCRYSELEFIKNNIMHSKLNEIFDLNNIDWIKIGKQCEKSLVKEVCEYWHLHNEIDNENLSTKYLSDIFKIDRTSVTNYLKRGNLLNWCNYNTKK